MPTDKIRPPDRFPAPFRVPLERGLGKWWMGEAQDRATVRAIARKYRTFLRSIEAYPLHPFFLLREGKTFRTSTEQHKDGQWILYIIVNRKIDFGMVLARKGVYLE